MGKDQIKKIYTRCKVFEIHFPRNMKIQREWRRSQRCLDNQGSHQSRNFTILDSGKIPKSTVELDRVEFNFLLLPA